jgi:hypothetical protein
VALLSVVLFKSLAVFIIIIVALGVRSEVTTALLSPGLASTTTLLFLAGDLCWPSFLRTPHVPLYTIAPHL